MTRPIDSTFTYDGHILQVTESLDGCDGCFFRNITCSKIKSQRGQCSESYRSDNQSIIFKLMQKPELKAGMLVEYNSNNYLLVPDSKGTLIGIQDQTFCRVFTSERVKDITKIGWPLGFSCTLRYQFGEILWEKSEEVILTMDEIAEKFGIPVEQLKIQK